MFCMKCGKQMDDDALVCPSCGSEVDRAQVDAAIEAHRAKANAEAAVATDKAQSMSETVDVEKKTESSYETPMQEGPVYDKPSKAPIIALIAAVLLLVCGIGIALFMINRPINKVNKAIEKQDIEVVDEYYGRLNEEDKAAVQEKMLDYANVLSKSYVDGKMDYDDIDKKFRLLSGEVLNDNSEFEELTKSVNRLNQSRKDYAAAQEAFDAKDYEKAKDLYGKVIADDANYKTARDRIAECEAKIAPDVKGMWSCTVDIGNAMLKQVGLNSSEKDFSFPMELMYEFKADGTGTISVDEDSVKEHLKEYVDIAIEEILRQYKLNYGMSEADIDKMFKSYYGKTFRGYITGMLEDENVMGPMNDASAEFTYVIEEDKVILTNEEGVESVLNIVDDTLQLKDMEYEEFTAFSQLGIELPLVFTRK